MAKFSLIWWIRGVLRRWLGIEDDIREINKDILAIMNKQLTLQYGDGELVKTDPVEASRSAPEIMKSLAQKLYTDEPSGSSLVAAPTSEKSKNS